MRHVSSSTLAFLSLTAALFLAPAFAAEGEDGEAANPLAELRRKRREDMSRLAEAVAVENAEENREAGKGSKDPTLEHVAMVALVLICSSVGLVVLMILYTVLRPQRVMQGGELFRRRPVHCFCVGILASVIFLVIDGLANVLPGPLRPLVWLALVLVYAHWVVSGLCMLAYDLGERLQGNLNVRSLGSSGMAVLYGGSALTLVGFLPALGQVVQFIALVSGLGTAVSRRFLKHPATPAVNDLPAAPEPPAEGR